MQKIILVIIAIIVNQIASGKDESKLQDDDILIPVNQCCNEENIGHERLLEISLFCTKDDHSNVVDRALSWDLFINFNPR